MKQQKLRKRLFHKFRKLTRNVDQQIDDGKGLKQKKKKLKVPGSMFQKLKAYWDKRGKMHAENLQEEGWNSTDTKQGKRRHETKRVDVIFLRPSVRHFRYIKGAG